MKILQTLIILASLTSLGQNAPDEIIYEKAGFYLEAFYSNDKGVLPSEDDKIAVKNLEDIQQYAALKAYESFKILIEKYPESKYFIEAHYYVGDFDFYNQRYDQSKQNLLYVVQSNFYDERDYFLRMSYSDLAEIAILEKNIPLAKKYVEEVNRTKPKYFSCGVARESEENHLKNLNAKLATAIKER